MSAEFYPTATGPRPVLGRGQTGPWPVVGRCSAGLPPSLSRDTAGLVPDNENENENERDNETGRTSLSRTSSLLLEAAVSLAAGSEPTLKTENDVVNLSGSPRDQTHRRAAAGRTDEPPLPTPRGD